ncbi:MULTISPECIES: aminotransferase class V-fold PLP-dependent enzyme [Pseudoalteromonas]|uniref:cysteine desulfurase n=1 Tax=Pseudoalteromonas rubra TaxID=43658 RepID=A0A5S3UT99_9GAMM|nr:MULTISPECIES: aminotransferase class V-fold PLP-dependent enzyme [Pseudoalteromonas]MCG7563354.1 aminotransferase class V-fold PLP-dependent enzyme [Pseudoalteromonas sp. McH1-42]MEC4089656.1 aminotransferase class V-fold PLP-dependent enzyme [Pseudoalteromonas rubra]QPB82831.1 aminotransferase class V-fold PLP-dependent enzyme [Pseudoalteromonas rubra]
MIQSEQDQLIYLDANATTPVLPEIAKVVVHTMQVCFGNPSSAHITGVQAKHLMEEARNKGREVIGATSGELLFTSGATEGIQTAIVSALSDYVQRAEEVYEKPVLMYGATEHKAVPNTLKHWNRLLGLDAQILEIPVDSKGILDLDFIAEHVEQAVMVCTMAANNETGIKQDLLRLEQVIREGNAKTAWMVDCVQALGKLPLQLSQTTIDYAPFSGHKLYAPKGIGFLYIRSGSPYTPFIAGGGQESGMRSGTENIPGIAALSTLFDMLLDKENSPFNPVEQLEKHRSMLAEAIETTFKQVTFHHDFALSVPTTLNFSVDHLTNKEVIDLLDAAGIRVSGGSACSSGSSRSFVLDAMNVPDWQSENAIRLSFGPADSEAQIRKACEALTSLQPILENNCLVVSDSTAPEQEACAVGLTQLRHQGACCWLYVTADKQAIIVDPVPELVPRLQRLLDKQGLGCRALLKTHLSEPASDAVNLLSHNLIDNKVVDDFGWPVDGTHGLLQESLIQLPGAEKESENRCYLLMQGDDVSACFAGKLLLPQGLGDSQGETACAASMAETLLRLNEILDDNSLICSALDYQQCFAINWHAQVQVSPLLGRLLNGACSTDEFIEQKASMDSDSSTFRERFLGALMDSAVPAVKALNRSAAEEWLQCHEGMIIDCREPYESDVSRRGITELFGNLAVGRVLNIPLSRMTDVLRNGALDSSQHYLLVCRTGNRSMQAGNTLAMLGFDRVANLAGGLALN